MRIQNTSDTACKRDIGGRDERARHHLGHSPGLVLGRLQHGGTQQVVTLQPGQSYSVSVTWLGRLSQKGCPADQPLAPKGSYKLTGRNGDVRSAPPRSP